jgi:hypothetical protein
MSAMAAHGRTSSASVWCSDNASVRISASRCRGVTSERAAARGALDAAAANALSAVAASSALGANTSATTAIFQSGAENAKLQAATSAAAIEPVSRCTTSPSTPHAAAAQSADIRFKRHAGSPMGSRCDHSQPASHVQRIAGRVRDAERDGGGDQLTGIPAGTVGLR